MSMKTGESSTSPSWRRLLLIPSAARLGAQAPRDSRVGWNRFWGEIENTGDGGDVLWDTSNPDEMAGHLQTALEYFASDLPVVDIGCGNGRQARTLSGRYPEVLGVDLSPGAIERARHESTGIENLRFLALDITLPDAGPTIVAAIGEANVFVRGVFHVLPPTARADLASAVRQVLGRRGRLFLAETNYPGDALGYIRYLGARPGRIPQPVRRAIQRLPKPQHFGAAEREECLPAAEWTIHLEGVTQISTIPLRQERGSESIPGYYAVLSPRPE